MKLDDDDFTLFAVPRRFDLDESALDARWRALQAEVHPDRFVSEGTASQRLALQWSLRVNEAHRRLKDPIQRAAILCELNGARVKAEDNTAMPADFLMQQMEWREALDAADSQEGVDSLAGDVSRERKAVLDRLRTLIDDHHDFAAASQQVRGLMFIERFARDVERRLDALNG
jgi:molecular chaperone HscB